MEFITKDDFKKAVYNNHYYSGRWEYFKEVIDFLKDKEFERVLEIGCYELPIVKDGDTADIQGNPKIKIDLDVYPWNLDNYDLIIALQTLEHLQDKKRAFREIKRLSKNAIISLPYKWNTPEDKTHHGIDEEKIAEWTNNEPIADKIISGIRIILFYKF